jgi:hypothetical protein
MAIVHASVSKRKKDAFFLEGSAHWEELHSVPDDRMTVRMMMADKGHPQLIEFEQRSGLGITQAGLEV